MGVNFPVMIAAYCQGSDIEQPGYRKGSYYFSTTAVRTFLRNMFTRDKHRIRIRDTQLACLLKDPVPELKFLTGKLLYVKRQ